MREADGNAAVCVSSFLSGQRKCPLGGGDQPFRPLKGGLDLDLLQFSDFLRAYNVDIVLVGSVVAVAGFFLGKLLKSRISDKCVVFLPFVLGIALYFAYGAIFTGNVAENAVLFAKNGLSCGSFAMAARVVVAQFFTKGKIVGKNELRAACVKELLAPYKALTDEEAEQIAEKAEADKEEAKTLIFAVCEDVSDAAAEFVIAALGKI